MVTAALLLATAVWGWTFALVKDALGEVGPLWFLSLRFALAALLALPLLVRLPEGRSGRNWRWGALLGLAMFGGYFFQTWGLVYTTAQKSGLITGLSVVLVPVIGWAFGRRPSRRTWLGVTLAAVGLVLLTVGGGELGGGAWLGDLLTALCAVSFALHLVLLDRFAKAGHPRALLAPQIGVVALLSLAGAAAQGQITLGFSTEVWVAVGVTGALATTGAFGLVLWAGRRLTASRMAIVLATEPAFATLFGWWLLGEVLLPWQAVGATLVVAGILSQRS
jgi:drug/metabolite transporter (DMT)-like permease